MHFTHHIDLVPVHNILLQKLETEVDIQSMEEITSRCFCFLNSSCNIQYRVKIQYELLSIATVYIVSRKVELFTPKFFT